MIAAMPLPLEIALPAGENSIGPRPLGVLLPEVLARYGISAEVLSMTTLAVQDVVGNWPQLGPQPLIGTGCVSAG